MSEKNEPILIDESTLTITNKKWQIKAKPSKELIQEILTIFSMPTSPTSPITTIDQILTRNILSTKMDDDALTVAAILLNFQTCLNIKINEKTQLGEVLRKMISLGFFSSQIYDLPNFSEELHSLILFVSNHLKNSNLNIPQCSMATAFLLSCISPNVPKISLFKNLNGIQDVLDIYLTKKVINDQVIPFFFDFFLSVFMSLTLDKKLEPNEFQLFSSLMKILASTLVTQISFNFDYISLTKKLLEYLSNHYLQITIRDELFNLILSLSSKYEEASSILVEPSNSSKISNFISDYLKLINFEYDLKRGSNPINLDTKVISSFISSQTVFFKPFKIKDENSEYVIADNFEYKARNEVLTISAIPEPGELEPIKKDQKISMTIQGLIQRISNLCRSITVQNMQANHIQFLSSFLRSEGARIPIGAFFIDLWAKNISFIQPREVAESFHNCKFYQTSLELAFFDYDDCIMKNFISSFILFISSFSPTVFSYIVDLINVFQNAVISVKLCPEICDLIVKCSIINPKSFITAMKCSNFDILMADDLYFYLNNCNNIEATGRSREESLRLTESYYLLMRFLVDISNELGVFQFLFMKNEFLQSVLSQFFCPSTAEFAYEIISKLVKSIARIKESKGDDVVSPVLRSIFKFFATKLFKMPGMPASVLNFVIQFCSLGFEKIEGQFGLIFRESHFFDLVVNLAIEQNLPNSIQALLNLFVHVTTTKKCSITPNIELFLKLGPMIRSREDVSVVDFLLKIIFNDDLKMTKPRKIVNPGPLSLLFQIFRDDKEKFKEFLKFVRECFEISRNETVQTDFTSQLIQYLREYRNKTEKDEEFDLVLDFLKEIMMVSITQKDLLGFFQLFTSTKDNIRPFFTGDLLKALTSSIHNYQVTSRSFFSLDSKGTIKIPPISADILNSDFSIVMKIELHDRTGYIFNFKNNITKEFLELSFTDEHFLSLNGKQYETTLITGKLIRLTLSSVKSEYFLYANYSKEPIIVAPKKKFDSANNQEDRKKGLVKNGLMNNVVGENLDANIEFFRIVYTNKSNKIETLYDFKASSFYQNLAIYKDEVAQVDCPIIHLPPSLLEVLISIGGVQVILPILNQIEQPTNATNPDPNENLLALALTLLSAIFSKSQQLQIDFYSIDGFTLVSELLTLISINKFNQPVFDEIFHLFSVIVEPDLQNQMIESIFFDLGTWVYIPDICSLFFDRCFKLLIQRSKMNRTFANYMSLNIKELLFLIRCHLFASTNTNDSICLSSSEKKTFAGDTFAQRQTVKKLRDNFMIFISELSSITCNLEDLHTIIFFCLDDQDEIFQRTTIILLKTIVSKKNHKLNSVIISKLPYKELIELLRNRENRKTASQLILFLNEAISNKFIHPQYKKAIIAKTIYEFKLFPIGVIYAKQLIQKTSGHFRIILTLNLLTLLLESNQKVPSINATKSPNTSAPASSENIENNTNPADSESLLQISDEDVLKQIVQMYKELIISISIEDFIENEIFFIIFLLHTYLDKKKYESIFDTLLNLTMDMWMKKLTDPFGFLHKFIETIECRAKSDYADFLRRIYISSISRDFSKASIESLMNVICRFLFEIPTFDSYSYLFRFPQPIKPLSFQELFLLANNNNSPFTATYHYSLRVNDNCKWMDIELANLFCEKYFPILAASNITKTIVLEQLAYIVGNGINNQSFLKRVPMFIELIKIIKNPKSDTENSISRSRKNAIIILLGNMSKQIFRGNYNYKNDETTPDQLIDVFKNSIEILHNEVSLILKEKIDLSNDLTIYLSSFATLITKIESDYENRLLSNSIQSGNTSITDLSITNSGNIFIDQDDNQNGSFTTANDPFFIYADLTALEANRSMSVNIEQYRASLSNYATARRKLKLQSLKRYKQLFSQLSSENGPWMSPENPPELHYKLFNSSTRSLLVPNLKFNDHKEASLARDLGSYENAQAILKEQIAKMKMQTFSTDFSLIDFKDVEDENNDKNDDETTNTRKQQQQSTTSNSNNEKDLMICQSQLVTPRKLHSGDLNLTIRSIIFNSKNKYVRIKLNKIKKILLRRYLMVDTAIEIFTTYSKVYFINFINASERLKFLNKVSSLKIPNIKFIQKKWEDSKVLIKKLIKKWQEGQISNFDYLMKINILAGRSFNDLSQYPVFPWVIRDYTSDKLDLSNPETYRCFSKPIGAIGQKRLAQMREKMEMGVGEETKYLYGALYSSPAVVIGYLIRMEPFTSLHVQLQSNRFDVADRLFISIPGAYESVTTSQMDFRELIPEFFINPDFLRNENNFDLGVSVTTGQRIDDVILPPWCSSPREFIEINKMVLESSYVTMNIHQWIDLIFGPHSRPPLSFECDNVFSPAFYETALDGADEAMVTYYKECAACFGCACLQIFDDFPEAIAVSISRKNCLGVPKSVVKMGEFAGKSIVALNSEKSDIVAVTNDLHFMLNETKGRLSCSIPPMLADKASPLVAINGRRNVAVALKWSNAVNVYHIKAYNNTVCEPSLYDSLPSSFTSSNNVVTAISISSNFLAVAFSDYTLRVFKLTKKGPNSIPLVSSPSNSSSQSNAQTGSTASLATTGSSAIQLQQQNSAIQTNLSNSQSNFLNASSSLPSLPQAGASGGSQIDLTAVGHDSSVGVAVAVGSAAAAVDTSEVSDTSFSMKRQVCFLSKHTHTILFTTVSEKVGAVYSISSDGFLSSMSLNQNGRYLRGVETGFYEPSHFIISRSGFIAIAFNGPDTANIAVYDQNLEKVASKFHEAAVETWAVAEWCGREELIVVNKSTENNTIEMLSLPCLTQLQKPLSTVQKVTAVSFIKRPSPRVLFGYANGTVDYSVLE